MQVVGEYFGLQKEKNRNSVGQNKRVVWQILTKGEKMTIQSDIVKKTIDRFPGYPNRTISRIILQQSGEYFDGDLEKIRDSVRWFSGAKGKESRSNKRDKILIPRTLRNKRKPYHLPPGVWALFFDVHVPYHEPVAIEAAFKHAQDQKATGIFFPGDLQDCAAVSHWQSTVKRDFDKELERFIDFLDFVEQEFPTQEKVWLPGNHEYRLDRYYQSKAPDLMGIPLIAFDRILALEQRKITRLENKQIVMAGKLPIIHGDEMRVSTAVNPARGLLLKAKTWAMCGHYHKTSEQPGKDLKGTLLTTWSVGCLCDLSPDYNPYGNDWNWGMALVNVEKNGAFEVENRRILPSGKLA